MYAAGSSIRPLSSARLPFEGLRHAGRWLLVAALIVLASWGLARVALGGTAPATSSSSTTAPPDCGNSASV